MDFFFTNQATATVSIAENMQSRSDHKPLHLSRPHVPGVMLEFERKKKSLVGQTLPQHHDLQIALFKHVSLGSTVGEIQQVLEMKVNGVNRDGEIQACEPMSDAEKRPDVARCELRNLTSSTVLQGCNSSSLGKLLPHESLIFDMVRRQKRLVAELRTKVVGERKLAALRLLGRKIVNRRLPSPLRNSEGRPVEDQSLWGGLVHEHFEEMFALTVCKTPRPLD